MDLYWLFLVLWLTIARAADTTPTKESFFKTLDDARVLNYAKLCQAAKKMGDTQSNQDATKTLQEQGLISSDAKVIIQGYRHVTKQLSSLVIKTGVNHFLMVFIGTKTALDVLSDLTAVEAPENLREKILSALDSLVPEAIDVRLKLSQRHDGFPNYQESVDVHLGFKSANEDLFQKMFKGIQPYYKPNVPVVFEITGHSMGGALGAQAAYHVMKYLPDRFGIDRDQVAVEVVLFASAGGFETSDIDEASEMIRAENSMVTFYRKDDFARSTTKEAGFANPGWYIYLDDFVAVNGTLEEYLVSVTHLEESPQEIAARISAENENHGIANYITTIEAGIADKLLPEIAKDSEEESQPKPTKWWVRNICSARCVII